MDWPGPLNLLLGVLSAIGFGIGAALLPMFVNAEVYIIALAANVESRSFLAFLIVVHVVATTIGKGFVFELARVGTRRLQVTDPKVPRTRIGRAWKRFSNWYSATRFAAWIRRVSKWLLSLLDRPYLGGVTVFVSALTMVPPLAVVTILAGASKQPRWLFLVTCFAGRLLQFLAIAFLLHSLPWFEDLRRSFEGG